MRDMRDMRDLSDIRDMRHCDAYTLVELMIVLVIIGILTSVAYPNYTGFVIKSRRIEAQIALLDIMQKQERYYSAHNSYIAFSADSSDPDEKRFKWWSGASARDSAYELSGHACPGLSLRSCIELRASPGTEKVNARFRDAACETLTLVSTGEHRAGGKLAGCWP